MLGFYQYFVMSDRKQFLVSLEMLPFNSLTSERCHSNFKSMIFNLIIQKIDWACEIAFRWMAHNLTNKKSTLVQVMACCHQATSHCLSQCWPRSISSYGFTATMSLEGVCVISFLFLSLNHKVYHVGATFVRHLWTLPHHYCYTTWVGLHLISLANLLSLQPHVARPPHTEALTVTAF